MPSRDEMINDLAGIIADEIGDRLRHGGEANESIPTVQHSRQTSHNTVELLCDNGPTFTVTVTISP